MKWINELEERLAEKDKRIEELEDQLNEELAFLSDCDVIITTDKIDAMWKYINRLKIAGDDHCSSLAVVIKEVLALAGIVACEECGGSGKDGYVAYDPHGVFEELGYDTGEGDCPSCGGHGWVSK